jgi:hypothetical protein
VKNAEFKVRKARDIGASCKSPNSVIPAAIISGNLVSASLKNHIPDKEVFWEGKQFCKGLFGKEIDNSGAGGL